MGSKKSKKSVPTFGVTIDGHQFPRKVSHASDIGKIQRGHDRISAANQAASERYLSRALGKTGRRAPRHGGGVGSKRYAENLFRGKTIKGQRGATKTGIIRRRTFGPGGTG